MLDMKWNLLEMNILWRCEMEPCCYLRQTISRKSRSLENDIFISQFHVTEHVFISEKLTLFYTKSRRFIPTWNSMIHAKLNHKIWQWFTNINQINRYKFKIQYIKTKDIFRIYIGPNILNLAIWTKYNKLKCYLFLFVCLLDKYLWLFRIRTTNGVTGPGTSV